MISVENIMLPNKPLSNFELKDTRYFIFQGSFLIRYVTKKPNKKECGIVNFDKSGGPDTYWVAWYKTVKLKSTSTTTACNLQSKLLST